MPPTTAPQIKPLPASATVRLRSTLAITSLSDAVSELVQNSLDAGARSVAVQVNVARNSCVVEDDGVGILPGDVGMVGRMYGAFACGFYCGHLDTGASCGYYGVMAR